MELQRGNQVEFGELGKFRLQLMSDGTDAASDFTSDNIKGVRIQFVPGDDLSDMFNQMEFTPCGIPPRSEGCPQGGEDGCRYGGHR